MDRLDLEKFGKLVNLEDIRSNTETEAPSSAPRPRAMTTLKLQWLAERIRKTERIKQALAAGNYKVDSRAVARAVLGYDANTNEGKD